MTNELSVLKGIHPGLILDRKLRERNLTKGRFALSIKAYPQTLTDIAKGRRGMNTALSLKIEHALGLEEGYFMTLQIFYEIKEEKAKLQKQSATDRPDLSILRSGLFWDTDINRIDWQLQRRAVIERILERGNDREKEEIKRFYGDLIFSQIADQIKLDHA